MRRPAQPRPATLAAEALAHAEDAYRRRTAEIKALEPMLAQLETLRPTLKAQGLEVFASNCSLTAYRPNGYNGREFKTLRLKTSGFWSTDENKVAAQWLAAFNTLGFEVIHRSGGTSYSHAVLRRGHLLIEVDAPMPPGADTVRAASVEGYVDGKKSRPVYADGTPELAAYAGGVQRGAAMGAAA